MNTIHDTDYSNYCLLTAYADIVVTVPAYCNDTPQVKSVLTLPGTDRDENNIRPYLVTVVEVAV